MIFWNSKTRTNSGTKPGTKPRTKLKSFWNMKPKLPKMISLNKYPKRTKAENRLITRKPYGDKDKDKVMNWYDCKPLNRKKDSYMLREEIRKRLRFPPKSQDVTKKKVHRALSSHPFEIYTRKGDGPELDFKKNVRPITTKEIIKIFEKNPDLLKTAEKVKWSQLDPIPGDGNVFRIGTYDSKEEEGAWKKHKPLRKNAREERSSFYRSTNYSTRMTPLYIKIASAIPSQVDERDMNMVKSTIKHELQHLKEDLAGEEREHAKELPYGRYLKTPREIRARAAEKAPLARDIAKMEGEKPETLRRLKELKIREGTKPISKYITVYHGTTKEGAEGIKKEGFKLSPPMPKTAQEVSAVYITAHKPIALHFGGLDTDKENIRRRGIGKIIKITSPTEKIEGLMPALIEDPGMKLQSHYEMILTESPSKKSIKILSEKQVKRLRTKSYTDTPMEESGLPHKQFKEAPETLRKLKELKIRQKTVPIEKAKYVTVYHGTTKEGAEGIKKEGFKLSPPNPRSDQEKSGVYVSAHKPMALLYYSKGKETGKLIKITSPTEKIEGIKQIMKAYPGIKSIQAWEEMTLPEPPSKKSIKILSEKQVKRLKTKGYTDYPIEGTFESGLPHKQFKEAPEALEKLPQEVKVLIPRFMSGQRKGEVIKMFNIDDEEKVFDLFGGKYEKINEVEDKKTSVTFDYGAWESKQSDQKKYAHLLKNTPLKIREAKDLKQTGTKKQFAGITDYEMKAIVLNKDMKMTEKEKARVIAHEVGHYKLRKQGIKENGDLGLSPQAIKELKQTKMYKRIKKEGYSDQKIPEEGFATFYENLKGPDMTTEKLKKFRDKYPTLAKEYTKLASSEENIQESRAITKSIKKVEELSDIEAIKESIEEEEKMREKIAKEDRIVEEKAVKEEREKEGAIYVHPKWKKAYGYMPKYQKEGVERHTKIALLDEALKQVKAEKEKLQAKIAG